MFKFPPYFVFGCYSIERLGCGTYKRQQILSLLEAESNGAAIADVLNATQVVFICRFEVFVSGFSIMFSMNRVTLVLFVSSRKQLCHLLGLLLLFVQVLGFGVT